VHSLPVNWSATVLSNFEFCRVEYIVCCCCTCALESVTGRWRPLNVHQSSHRRRQLRWGRTTALSEQTSGNNAWIITVSQHLVLELLVCCILTRVVTKFEFEFHNIRTLNVFDRFEIVECFKSLVVECEFAVNSLFYDWFLMHSKKLTADRQCRQIFL